MSRVAFSLRNSHLERGILVGLNNRKLNRNQRRNLTGLLRMATKIRYWLLAGGIGAGASAKMSYDEWKANLPDLKWISDPVKRVIDSLPENEAARKQFGAFTEGISETSAQLAEKYHEAMEQLRASFPEKKPASSSATTNSSSSFNADDEITKHFQVQLKQKNEIERLEKENRELRSKILIIRQQMEERERLRSGELAKKRSKSNNLIELYSEILDELTQFSLYCTSALSSSDAYGGGPGGFLGLSGGGSSMFDWRESLPRIVVVGDQSAGKTSVLEAVVGARIFPRGAGEMMTRSPVMVTLSEGPYHVAKFKDASEREYDLSSEKDLKQLRDEIERRMVSSVASLKLREQTRNRDYSGESAETRSAISSEVIALDVRGPDVKRMVLVDLPGVINTVTLGMHRDTKSDIQNLAYKYMNNPNAIILCVQDGSVDAERSLVTDMVRQVDPTGFRTIFVLTKIDLAVKSMQDPTRIQNILDGKLFPMKALGYFAVITGKGSANDSISDIKQYEEDFFTNSEIVRTGLLKPHQTTTQNMSTAVSNCFWKMVTESIESQVDQFRCHRFNLETEWKNTFSKFRQLTADEHFEKAKNEILDEVLDLDSLPTQHWDRLIYDELWKETYKDVFETIFLPAASRATVSRDSFRTMSDIALRQWADSVLPQKSVEIARKSLVHELLHLMDMKSVGSPDYSIYKPIRDNLRAEIGRLDWDNRAADSIRIIQQSSLEDRSMAQDQQAWNNASNFYEKLLTKYKEDVSKQLSDRVGPDFRARWTQWTRRDQNQEARNQIQFELRRLLASEPNHGAQLASDEFTAIRKNLANNKMQVTNVLIDETWQPMYRLHVIEKAFRSCKECKSLYHHKKKGFSIDNSPDSAVNDFGGNCDDLMLMMRLQRSFNTSAIALRQHIVNNETRRLSEDIRELLEDLSTDSAAKQKLLGANRRVVLAEQIFRVRSIQSKLDLFVHKLKSSDRSPGSPANTIN